MEINTYKLLLEQKNVNNYTKMIITLSELAFYNDYYIPNKKLMNMMKLKKPNIIRLLNQLEKNDLIVLYYKDKKRYFCFKKYIKEKKDPNKNIKKEEPINYDWLNEVDVNE